MNTVVPQRAAQLQNANLLAEKARLLHLKQ